MHISATMLVPTLFCLETSQQILPSCKSLVLNHISLSTATLCQALCWDRVCSRDSLDSILKSRDITLPTKVLIVKSMVFPVIMYRCESWTIKKTECQKINAFELWCWGRLLDSKEIKPTNPKGNQLWIFIRRTDGEAEAPILWPPNGKSQLIEKDPDAGEDWRQEEKRAVVNEMVRWHLRLTEHMFEQTGRLWRTGKPGNICSWDCKELDTTQWLNNNNTC